MRVTPEFLTNASPSLLNRVYRHSPRSCYGRYEFATAWNSRSPGPLFFSLRASPALVTSLSLCLFFSLSLFLSRSYSARVPLFKVPFCSSLCAPYPCHPHFHSANLRCSTEKSKSPLAVARTGLQNELGAIKKDAGWSAYGSSCTSFHKTPGNRLMYVWYLLKITQSF